MRTYGRDSRRRLSVLERRQLFDQAGGLCQRCGAPLGPDWHQAHLRPWTDGGATHLDNMEAWCPACNLGLGTTDKSIAIELREWQRQALPKILVQLYERGTATLHAAPGAGKTIFTGVVWKNLADQGLVERLVVVVPNTALVRQWSDSLSTSLGVHLDPAPHLGYLELDSTVGAVVTYGSLLNTARNHRGLLKATPTLVAFDEVHHLASDRSWGKAAMEMIQEQEELLAQAVLNTTGTLFRSRKDERIPTVRYREVEISGRPAIEADADYSVPATDLIVGKQLRPVDLLTCGSTVELVDLRQEEVIAGEVADISNAIVANAAHRRMIEDPIWIEGFARHMMQSLARQSQAIGENEPLKALWVARDIRTARLAQKIINRVAGEPRFAHLVVSDEPGALRVLRAAARADYSLAIVSVQMITEGFDCPHISTIAYAHNIKAPLYLTQMVARGMRLTKTEQSLGRPLPTHLLIPDVRELRQACAEVLVAKLHVLELDDDQRLPVDRPLTGDQTSSLTPRWQLTSVTAPRRGDVDVVGESDGTVTQEELAPWEEAFEALNVPVVFAPRAALAERRIRRQTLLREHLAPIQPPVATSVQTRSANPRDVSDAWRRKIDQCAKWWAVKGVTPPSPYEGVQFFQAAANEHAGIGKGERDRASSGQLMRVLEFMEEHIRDRCQAMGEERPAWLDGGTS